MPSPTEQQRLETLCRTLLRYFLVLDETQQTAVIAQLKQQAQGE